MSGLEETLVKVILLSPSVLIAGVVGAFFIKLVLEIYRGRDE